MLKDENRFKFYLHKARVDFCFRSFHAKLRSKVNHFK